jgi:Protein of unknown function (DUF2795)
MNANPIEVQQYLKGASYPTSAEDLASLARDNGAPDEIIQKLESAGGEISGPDDVMRQLAN